ncbi:hypothetical protein [Flavobacterium aquidurense]|uniref:hypothetical protein n=1 Tax=Flavobacterium aquidurense TaxID=362413 RepID=UPI002856DD4C|nr:hypothetical protein [Flavobacterium aquidurense]MDR7371057.1 hypothetical protein [Flavobacterium aquidurense]
MKNFLLCMIFLFQFSSCSTDSDFDNAESFNASKSKQISFSAENKRNPMDAKGKKYSDVLSFYLKSNKVPNSKIELTNQINFISKEFLKGNSLEKKVQQITPEQISTIMDNPESALLEIIEDSTLGSNAKSELLEFVQSLIDRQNDNYSDVYLYIIAFEDEIIQNTSLFTDEKNAILTISSVSRYVLYAEARKDRDWETSVGNRIAQPFLGFNQAAIISLLALLEEII